MVFSCVITNWPTVLMPCGVARPSEPFTPQTRPDEEGSGDDGRRRLVGESDDAHGRRPTEVSVHDRQSGPGGFGRYTLEYDATESTAVNADNEPITGPIRQHVVGKDRKPRDGQPVRMRYLREGPVVFQLLEPIEFVDR